MERQTDSTRFNALSSAGNVEHFTNASLKLKLKALIEKYENNSLGCRLPIVQTEFV
jgi:hypothetical protein